MKQIVQEPGGRLYFGEDFMNTQEEVLLSIIEPFLAEWGQFIFCGCRLENNAMSKGVVVLNGKACKFAGSAAGITPPYYVRYAEQAENVQYKTGVDVGYITYLAEPCAAGDAGAFRLDNAPRFADMFVPNNATNAANAAMLNGKPDTAFATAAQGGKADTAVQAATLGGAAVAKSGTTLQLPAYPTALPANGGNADTVDSKHASDFRAVFTNLGAADFNDIRTPGDYFVSSNTNAPTTQGGWHLNVERTTSNPDTYVIQTAAQFDDQVNGIYWRKCYNGTNWTPWRRLVSYSADGSLTAVAFYDSSDERLKSDIAAVDTTAIEQVEFKQYVKNGKKEVGVIAQQVRQYMPDAVVADGSEEAYLSVSYNAILSAKCALYENKIADLEKRLKNLEGLLNG